MLPESFSPLLLSCVWVIVQLLFVALVSLSLYGAYHTTVFFYNQATSAVRHIPGPASQSWLYGNYKEVWTSESSILYAQWAKEYGPTFQYTGLFGASRLYTMDHKALNHVLASTHIYQKPESGIYNIKRILGAGVLLVEDETHRRQRKALNPAFGPQQIRELTEIFVDKALHLRDIWIEEVKKHEQGVAGLDALAWLSRATLDIIGWAGFNYNFNALEKGAEEDELSGAFAAMFSGAQRFSIIPILRGLVPPLRFLPAPSDAEASIASKTMFRIGAQLLNDSKQTAAKNEKDKKSWEGRDILSLLVRANMMPGIADSQRLSDEEVLAQIPTFMVAGHETTSVAVTWALFALTQNNGAQSKLRTELETVSTDNPTMDELNALPYLDSVVRETLRVHAPVPASMRTAMQDDIIPLQTPYTDKLGNTQSHIHLKKGQTIIIPIGSINKDETIWGQDAAEFNPERWQHVPEGSHSIPGVWGNMMTFLGGPKACIGYRFSVTEMKALIFTLVRAFEFELAVPASSITKKTALVQRPVLKDSSDGVGKNELPLLVRLASM
ncbi:hypothetical protein D9619_012227 [Psilocybe cf. subviscida]|uniref:Cytochrome P450 n=1 Tax=Psilocybe cf. subviscida TaxID=2480587 RepID=A0A8H5B7R4_9AGAR|nr:hypothetical protein D9619_012227 [Psilocybe cf. subviscida]